MKISIIGCGVMGSAFARAWSNDYSVYLFDSTFEKAKKLADEIKGEAFETLGDALGKGDLVLLAIKPKDLPKLAAQSASLFRKKQILMSILAGTPLRVLRDLLPTPKVVRLMPNLALLYGEGILGVVEDDLLSIKDKKGIEKSLSQLGAVVWLPENKIDGFTSLTASGPAFIMVIFEALVEGAVAMGLTFEESSYLALKTMKSSIALLERSQKLPAEIKMEIASPGGMTIAGLNVLEEEDVKSALVKALIAAYKRALEMNTQGG